ncbi:MAG: bifunctional N(6)-L-threonylcarbamoyladenine synthase/serine/threonine protein kinase [Candidatus Thermoplasmatota archaeon]|nr:bifunctional N(6)-L-threonylcarbamoyladenine synthase/serine/threonine protein kinase [Candidatus Thermoplasmatota archaeon]
MRILGIESTAHTFGAGIVLDGKIVSNVRNMYVPDKGGIHPREAADHHVKVGVDVVRRSLEEASIEPGDLDLVAFSRGPGLGPCLRVGATIARVMSLQNGIPIIGANHCVAHLEIGELLGAEDPVLLYTSGGNTQVIAFVKRRYRVMGETLDIGIGNMLDKLGREMGIPFPAGPKIELLARGEAVPGVKGASGEEDPEFLELPYSVKGMDMSFSGVLTAALNLRRKGASIHSVCRSVQETCFSMLCEVTERAVAHIGAEEVLLGGGVACNSRLKEMVSIMARERGAKSFAPPPSLAVDNGAMIAYLGERMYLGGARHELKDTIIDQKFRTDQVEVIWKKEREIMSIHTPGTVEMRAGTLPGEGEIIGKGAEAVITRRDVGDIPAVEKFRVPKGYRVKDLEGRLKRYRTRNEARMLGNMRSNSVRTPYVLDADPEEGILLMELLPGPRLASVLNTWNRSEQMDALFLMGKMIGDVHFRDMVHGDLTTSNFIVLPEGNGSGLGLIDMSLSERTEEIEKKGVDLRLFFEVFHSTHGALSPIEESFWEGYRSSNRDHDVVKKKMRDIDRRGRYLSERWTQ